MRYLRDTASSQRIIISLFFATALFLCCQVNAQTNVLKLYKTDGTTASYPFAQHPTLVYRNDSIIVRSSEMEISYPINIIRKYTLNETMEIVNPNEVVINNDIIDSYSNEEDIHKCNICYIRTFTDTQWQSLYVPFDIPVSLIDEDFDIAVINNFHQYDDDKDGVFDRTELEIRKSSSSDVLQANYPYLIRAKEAGTKTISLLSSTLYATDLYSIDCSSVELKYTFTGTYDRISDLCSTEFYFLENGYLNKAYSTSTTLDPFRWYMTITPRANQYKDSPIIINSKVITIRLIGEDNTDIKEVHESIEGITTSTSYSIHGYQAKPTGTGIYIIRMSDGGVKKVFIK